MSNAPIDSFKTLCLPCLGYGPGAGYPNGGGVKPGHFFCSEEDEEVCPNLPFVIEGIHYIFWFIGYGNGAPKPQSNSKGVGAGAANGGGSAPNSGKHSPCVDAKCVEDLCFHAFDLVHLS